jgi:hypothetical protein
MRATASVNSLLLASFGAAPGDGLKAGRADGWRGGGAEEWGCIPIYPMLRVA